MSGPASEKLENMVNNSPLLEICVDSVDSALAAQRGGAQQVELCADLLEGGITPSAGMIEQVRSRIGIGLQVIIRPRGGDFCYSDEEIEIMKRDIRTAKQLGANGLSLGILNSAGQIDTGRTRALADLAKPLEVTFHRAFDMTADLAASLEALVLCGVHRVLTSGGFPLAERGISRIAELVQLADRRIAIMVCGGVRHHNVAQILKATGAREVHSNPKILIDGPMKFRNHALSLSSPPRLDFQRSVICEEDVRRLCDAAQSAVQNAR